MKHSFFALLAAALLGRFNPNPDNPDKKRDPKPAQQTEMKAFNVQKEFEENGFTFFTENLILCSGDTTVNNAMTIGWGSIGNYLGHNRPAVTVYVAPARYTYEFMERYPRFTIMHFSDPKIAKYLGSRTRPRPISATTPPRSGTPTSVPVSMPSTSAKSSVPGNDNPYPTLMQ